MLQQNEIEKILPETTLAAIENSIERIVESKVINAMEKFNEAIKTNIEKSYAQAIKDGQNDAANKCDKNGNRIYDFKKIVRDSQNEQLIAEKQREVRSANFIIYGVKGSKAQFLKN